MTSKHIHEFCLETIFSIRFTIAEIPISIDLSWAHVHSPGPAKEANHSLRCCLKQLTLGPNHGIVNTALILVNAHLIKYQPRTSQANVVVPIL
jgi:hypothetical protein